MDDYERLGLRPGRGATDLLVRKVEGLLGVALPAEYVELVKFHEEPAPEVCVFHYEGG